MTFSKLHNELQQTLEKQGYTTPTPIQDHTIAHALAGRDVIGIANTGTGKTAAFLLPVLDQLHRNKAVARPHKPLVLVLCPTRELAEQVHRSARTYGRRTGIGSMAIYGGVGYGPQKNTLKKGVEIVVATPGRLKDLMDQRSVNLSDVKYFILDEADRMLDMGFLPDIEQISKQIPKEHQTLLFSATTSKAVNDFARKVLNNPKKVELETEKPTAEGISQKVYHVPSQKKAQLMETYLREGEKTIVFARTKRRVERLARSLGKTGFKVARIHGDKSQNFRKRSISKFKDNNVQVLVATDVAARGLDIDDVQLVINYDLPDDADNYIHRIGRTGRAGRLGRAVSLCSPEEMKKYEDIIKVLNDKKPAEEWKYDKSSKQARVRKHRRDRKKSKRNFHHKRGRRN